jgi:hypothetical protein
MTSGNRAVDIGRLADFNRLDCGAKTARPRHSAVPQPTDVPQTFLALQLLLRAIWTSTRLS